MKTYLGDGVYVRFNGHSLILTTENGISTTNTIFLEPSVFAALLAFAQKDKGIEGVTMKASKATATEIILTTISILALFFILLLIAPAIKCQTRLVATGGASTAGLGSRAGLNLGSVLEARRGPLTFSSHFTYDFSDKVGSSGSSFSTSEKLLVRYGRTIQLGGGLGLYHVRGAFGSRSAASPLVEVAYAYRPNARYDSLLYVTVRPFEVGNNYTREHRTRGVEGGIELWQTWGRLVGYQQLGVEALSYRNLSEPGARRGAYAFVRGGIGLQFGRGH